MAQRQITFNKTIHTKPEIEQPGLNQKLKIVLSLIVLSNARNNSLKIAFVTPHSTKKKGCYSDI